GHRRVDRGRSAVPGRRGAHLSADALHGRRDVLPRVRRAGGLPRRVPQSAPRRRLAAAEVATGARESGPRAGARLAVRASRTCGPHVLWYLRPLASDSPPPPVDSAATKASCGTSTRPMVSIRFLPSFCLSSSFRLREISPP